MPAKVVRTSNNTGFNASDLKVPSNSTDCAEKNYKSIKGEEKWLNYIGA